MSIVEMIIPERHRRVTAATGRTGRADEDAARTSTWNAWGTTASVTVTDPASLQVARRLVARQFAAAEKAAARYRKDAEVHRLYRAGGRAITVSPLLAELVAAALAVAERTDGDVDPTVAAAMTAIHDSPSRCPDSSAIPTCGTGFTGSRPVPGWQQVDLRGRRLRVPTGSTLDLSATATSVVCDRAAAEVRARLGVGVLVTLGGDAASAGPAPEGGWRVAVDDRIGGAPIGVLLPAGAALATSHFTARPGAADWSPDSTCWVRGGHLIDPRTGRAPVETWRMATAIGFTSLEASSYTSAALIRGSSARAWLTELWVPARLVTLHGDVITVGRWTAHDPSSPEKSSDRAGVADVPVPFPMPRLADPRRTTR